MPTFAAPETTAAPRWLFLRFAGLAGLGWLLDAGLLLALVTLGGIPAARANVASSCTAAVTVFLLSRQTLFQKASHHFLLRVVCYVIYTLLLIFAASMVLGWLVDRLAPVLAEHLMPGRALIAAAAAAKVIVTPPQLLSNFFMSRFLSERNMRPRVERA